MRYVVVDIEANGLLDTATKIHCLCWHDVSNNISGSITDYSDIINFLSQTDIIIVGHNFILYDKPLVKKILGYEIKCKIADSLWLSWALYPKEEQVGLEFWGYRYNIIKPLILVWQDDGTKEFMDGMINRCSKDVEINTKLWLDQYRYLKDLYYNNEDDIRRYIGYLSYKAECGAEQEDVKWKLDIDTTKKNLAKLELARLPKMKILEENMPPNYIYAIKERPKKEFKKDGSVSALGQKWLDFLVEQGLPLYHNGSVRYIKEIKQGNIQSNDQKKDWLFSLGWKPTTFKYIKDKNTPYDKKTPPRKVPQLVKTDRSGLCDSVTILFDKEPVLEHLEGLTQLAHRIHILEGFLENVDKDGFVKAEISGLTNTLRMKHRVVVNLPTVFVPYGKEMRECLIAPDDNHVLCGSDMSGLEDQCKRHYIWKYDPQYVLDMMTPGFDPHLDIGKQGGIITSEEEKFYKWYNFIKEDIEKGLSKYEFADFETSKFKDIGKRRKDSKQGNFSCTYGAGPAKMVIASGMTLEIATIVHTAFWKRNWALKEIEKDCIVKTINGQMWLYNPVSGFWYSLRAEKDRFSTLNQGTAAYVFDTWIRKIRNKSIKICGQFHDEHIAAVLKGKEEDHRKLLLEAIDETNDELKLNVKLGISIAFGKNYADVH